MAAASRVTSLAQELPADVGSPGGAHPGATRSMQVIVRLRPALRRTWDAEPKPIVEVDTASSNVVTHDGINRHAPTNTYHFDAVLDSHTNQEEVYARCAAPLVERFLEGYNSTIMAFGQTGAGKTHTIGHQGQRGDEQGVVQRALRQVFDHVAAHAVTAEFDLTIQFVEIYNEELRDLLGPAVDPRPISITQQEGVMALEGATVERVAGDAEGASRALSLFLGGCASRTTGATCLNERSSRAHAIFTVSLTRSPASEPEVSYLSKLHIVDLAGSERNKRTKAEGTRMREAIHINKGLLVLQKVMQALGANSRRSGGAGAGAGAAGGGATPARDHVPYRESKLTRYLQDSLGGSAFTCLVACISGEPADLEETLHSLKYAAGARRIRNTPSLTRKVTEARHVELLQHSLLNLAQRAAQGADRPSAAARILQQLDAAAVWEVLKRLAGALAEARAAAAPPGNEGAPADGGEDAASAASLSRASSPWGERRSFWGSLTPHSLLQSPFAVDGSVGGDTPAAALVALNAGCGEGLWPPLPDGTETEPNSPSANAHEVRRQLRERLEAAAAGGVGASLGVWLPGEASAIGATPAAGSPPLFSDEDGGVGDPRRPARARVSRGARCDVGPQAAWEELTPEQQVMVLGDMGWPGARDAGEWEALPAALQLKLIDLYEQRQRRRIQAAAALSLPPLPAPPARAGPLSRASSARSAGRAASRRGSDGDVAAAAVAVSAAALSRPPAGGGRVERARAPSTAWRPSSGGAAAAAPMPSGSDGGAARPANKAVVAATRLPPRTSVTSIPPPALASPGAGGSSRPGSAVAAKRLTPGPAAAIAAAPAAAAVPDGRAAYSLRGGGSAKRAPSLRPERSAAGVAVNAAVPVDLAPYTEIPPLAEFGSQALTVNGFAAAAAAAAAAADAASSSGSAHGDGEARPAVARPPGAATASAQSSSTSAAAIQQRTLAAGAAGARGLPSLAEAAQAAPPAAAAAPAALLSGGVSTGASLALDAGTGSPGSSQSWWLRGGPDAQGEGAADADGEAHDTADVDGAAAAGAAAAIDAAGSAPLPASDAAAADAEPTTPTKQHAPASGDSPDVRGAPGSGGSPQRRRLVANHGPPRLLDGSPPRLAGGVALWSSAASEAGHSVLSGATSVGSRRPVDDLLQLIADKVGGQQAATVAAAQRRADGLSLDDHSQLAVLARTMKQVQVAREVLGGDASVGGSAAGGSVVASSPGAKSTFTGSPGGAGHADAASRTPGAAAPSSAGVGAARSGMQSLVRNLLGGAGGGEAATPGKDVAAAPAATGGSAAAALLKPVAALVSRLQGSGGDAAASAAAAGSQPSAPEGPDAVREDCASTAGGRDDAPAHHLSGGAAAADPSSKHWVEAWLDDGAAHGSDH